MNFRELLPYFCRSESYQQEQVDVSLQGADGPFLPSARGLYFALRNDLAAWQQINPSLKCIQDIISGHPLGIGEVSTSLVANGDKQFSHNAYNLDGVNVLTDSLVHRISSKAESSHELTATGTELVNKQRILATKEAIICSGAYNSPKLLLLSGIGP